MASFKTDESFLEKISIGAIGTQQVFSILRQLGHQPIELERGSMNYKIWKKIKIKRIRVPDILCVDNGIRIESRAKTNLEISMSHSTSDPERGWDFGMKDNDYVALVVCEKFGDKPIDWKADNLVQFISIKELREAEKQDQVVFIKAKGAQEGFEARINWPASLASSEGTVIEIDKTIKYKTVEGKTKWVGLSKGGKTLSPLVKVGDKVFPNQIVASVIKAQQTIPTAKVNTDFFLANLSSLTLSERYAAAKALSYFNEKKVVTALQSKLADNEEHIYVKLEAAASLSRFGIDDGYNFIKICLKDNYLQNVLESVIVLAEIKTDTACKMLCDILLNENYDTEIRAGAAWGLGEQQNKTALTAVVSSFNDVDTNIKTEAARALAKLSKNFSNDILKSFGNASSTEKPGIAWALTKSTTINLDQLISNLKDIDSRHWVSFIIGTHGEDRYIAEIEKLKNKDPQVYFAVTLLWKILTSWIHDLKEY
ncbi:MAG: HEAT repeat domain-containing protein [Bacteroidales bacterium]|jgi:hypothetical protein